MLRAMEVPASFALIKKGNKSLIIRKDLLERLKAMGMAEPMEVFKGALIFNNHHKGRTFHPSVPLVDSEKLIMRKGRRGGLLGKFVKESYLNGSRPFRELMLTEEARTLGIPTAEVVAAQKEVFLFGLLNKFSLFSFEIKDSLSLSHYVRSLPRPSPPNKIREKRRIIEKLASLVSAMHQAGLFHADLHLGNLVLQWQGDRPEISLIDLDKSYIKRPLSQKEKIRNLLRLERSALKLKREGCPLTRTDFIRFLKGYLGPQKRPLKLYLTLYMGYRKLYQWKWRMADLFFGKRGGNLFLLRKERGFPLHPLPERNLFSAMQAGFNLPAWLTEFGGLGGTCAPQQGGLGDRVPQKVLTKHARGKD